MLRHCTALFGIRYMQYVTFKIFKKWRMWFTLIWHVYIQGNRSSRICKWNLRGLRENTFFLTNKVCGKIEGPHFLLLWVDWWRPRFLYFDNKQNIKSTNAKPRISWTPKMWCFESSTNCSNSLSIVYIFASNFTWNSNFVNILMDFDWWISIA